MGIIKDAVGGILGSGAKAAKSAAGAQTAAVKQAESQIKDSTNQGVTNEQNTRQLATQALSPYQQIGQQVATSLVPQVTGQSQNATAAQNQSYGDLTAANKLINDPNAQKSFIENNPFFQQLATQAKNDVFNNAAAKGKVGSGGTAEALQNSLLLLGNSLVGNQIQQQEGAATTGANIANQNVAQQQQLLSGGQIAATNTVSADLNTGKDISNLYQNEGKNLADLLVGGGNAQAAGITGARDAQVGAANNVGGLIGKGISAAGGIGKIASTVGSFLGI